MDRAREVIATNSLFKADDGKQKAVVYHKITDNHLLLIKMDRAWNVMFNWLTSVKAGGQWRW